MKYNRVISTAVLFLLIGSTLPAFAQKGDEEKGGGQKAQPAQHEAQPQHAQKAAPRQQAQKAEPQRAEKAAPQQAQKAAPQRAAQPQRAEKAAPQQAQKPAPQRAEKAAPQHTEKAPVQRAQAHQPVRQQTQTVASNRGGGGGNYGRISNANYSAHFGHEHSFHVGHPQMIGGYNRFQYGGYWFGYNQVWPIGWGFDDDCYVVFADGAYYMYDLNHPGIHISLNIF